jgi:hypothetical protein
MKQVNKRTGPGIRIAAFGSLALAFTGVVLAATFQLWLVLGGCFVVTLLASQVVGQVIAYDAIDGKNGRDS